jgi:hypothetical protein
MSGRQDADHDWPHSRRRHAELPCECPRLPSLPVEGPMLSQDPATQSHAQHSLVLVILGGGNAGNQSLASGITALSKVAKPPQMTQTDIDLRRCIQISIGMCSDYDGSCACYAAGAKNKRFAALACHVTPRWGHSGFDAHC